MSAPNPEDPGAGPARRVRRQRGLAEKLGSVILAFEAIVVALAGLTIFGLKALGPDIEPWWAIVGGAVVSLAMLIVAGLTRTRFGIVLGWILQLIVALSAFLVPAILIVAVVFGGMWTYAMIVGGRVDRAARRADPAAPLAPGSPAGPASAPVPKSGAPSRPATDPHTESD